MDKFINITSTGVDIVPYRKFQSPVIEKATSKWDKLTHKRNPVTGFLISDEIGKVDRFVTHLHDRNFLQNNFPDYMIKLIRRDNGKELSDPIHMKSDVAPREVQYELIQQVMSDNVNKEWFIYLSQGLGKTLLSVYLISYFGRKSLIMCYRKIVLEQWYRTIVDKTEIDPKKVLIIESSKIFKNILDGTFPVWEYDIFMCTPGILTKFAKKYGYNQLKPLFSEMGIGFKIFDEAHMQIENIIKINALTSVNRTLYLSGDFGQSNDIKQTLYYRMFHNVPILTPSEDLMNVLKFTVAVVVQYNSHPTELDKTSVYTRIGFSFYNYMKYQIQKPIFYDVLNHIMNQIEGINTKGYKILILVNMIDHVDILHKEISADFPNKIVGRYHSKVQEEERIFCRNSCNVIVSTYDSFSTGIDVELIKYVISCSVCTKIEDNQASGRARPLPDGSDAYYFMMSDFGFDYTKKTLNKRLKYLNETKIKEIRNYKYVD